MPEIFNLPVATQKWVARLFRVGMVHKKSIIFMSKVATQKWVAKLFSDGQDKKVDYLS